MARRANAAGTEAGTATRTRTARWAASGWTPAAGQAGTQARAGWVAARRTEPGTRGPGRGPSPERAEWDVDSGAGRGGRGRPGPAGPAWAWGRGASWGHLLGLGTERPGRAGRAGLGRTRGEWRGRGRGPGVESGRGVASGVWFGRGRR